MYRPQDCCGRCHGRAAVFHVGGFGVFVFHFTPTSASWLNAIEGFLAKLTKKRLKHGVFRSLRELKGAVHRFLDHTNAKPKPFTWTRTQTESSLLSNGDTKC